VEGVSIQVKGAEHYFHISLLAKVISFVHSEVKGAINVLIDDLLC